MGDLTSHQRGFTKHSSLCVTFRDQVWLVDSWHSGHTWRENDLLYYSTWRELAFQLGQIPQGWHSGPEEECPGVPYSRYTGAWLSAGGLCGGIWVT